MYQQPTKRPGSRYARTSRSSPGRTSAFCATGAGSTAENIDEYIARDGYSALAKALNEMTPEQIIDEVKKSGLARPRRRRLPHRMKWEFCAKTPRRHEVRPVQRRRGRPRRVHGPQRPGGRPARCHRRHGDRRLRHRRDAGLHLLPRRVSAGYRAAHIAIAQAREYGLLGENILGTGFNFDIKIAQGAGAFVCGEETALMTSIEGKRGEPRPRPPFPAQKGLWGKPSVLNNVETFANIAGIIRSGADWFAHRRHREKPGHEDLRPLRQGQQRRSGRSAHRHAAGRHHLRHRRRHSRTARSSRPRRSAAPRAAASRATPERPRRLRVAQELGAIMGSGGLIVMDEDTCMVDMARFFLDFTQDELLRQVPALPGRHQADARDRHPHLQGEGEEGDIEKLIELGNTIKDTALCGLGQTAPNPVLSTIRYFRDEFEAHIRDKHCEAGVCSSMFVARAPMPAPPA